MAMTTPILYSVGAFDATQAYTFSFYVQGGAQVAKNKLTIKNNSTLATVYEQTITSFALSHTVAANTLTNGTTYQATVTTYDASNNASSPSEPILFQCIATPTFQFTNITEGGIVTGSANTFTVSYAQAQSVILNQYTFTLYNSLDIEIASSGVQYNTSTTLPLTLSYLFSGFNDGDSYGVRCAAVTANGMAIDTGIIGFTVQYSTPAGLSYMRVTNHCLDGYVSIVTNVVSIEGESYPSPPTYIASQEVDLSSVGSWVKWTSGYELSANYTLGLWGRNLQEGVLLEMSHVGEGIVRLTYKPDLSATNKKRIKLEAISSYMGDGYQYTTYSNSITTPTSSQSVRIYVRCVNNVYDVSLTVLQEETE